MSRIAWIALGAFIFLASLWAGSFLMHWLGWGHWAHFPTLITFMLTGVAGVVITVQHIDS